MLILITAIVLLSVYLTSCDGKDIMAEQLPVAAQQYIDDNYLGYEVITAQKNFELFSSIYEVKLEGGTELYFDSNGVIIRVDDSVKD